MTTILRTSVIHDSDELGEVKRTALAPNAVKMIHISIRKWIQFACALYLNINYPIVNIRTEYYIRKHKSVPIDILILALMCMGDVDFQNTEYRIPACGCIDGRLSGLTYYIVPR